MATKKSRPLDDPPVASSSEEEESSSDEEEDVQQKPREKTLVKKPPQEPEEEEEEEEEDGEEEEGEEDDDEDEDETEDEAEKEKAEKKTAKKAPLVQSPAESEDSQRASDFTVKPAKAVEKEPSTPVSKKRGDNGPMPNAKRAKTSAAAANGDAEEPATVGKKGGINRLWSDEDELAILEGLSEFKAKTGHDPSLQSSKYGEFLEFLKKSLHVEVTKDQLMNKVKRLKKKFKNNAAKSVGGADPVFSKPHEIKSYRLSKKLWGSSATAADEDENGDASSVKTKSTAAKGKDGTTSRSRGAKKSDASDKQALSVASVLTKMSAHEEGSKKGEAEKVGVDCEEEGGLEELYPSLVYVNGNMMKQGLVSGFDGVGNNLSVLGKSTLEAYEEKAKKLALKEMELQLARVEFARELTSDVVSAMKSSK